MPRRLETRPVPVNRNVWTQLRARAKQWISDRTTGCAGESPLKECWYSAQAATGLERVAQPSGVESAAQVSSQFRGWLGLCKSRADERLPAQIDRLHGPRVSETHAETAA